MIILIRALNFART